MANEPDVADLTVTGPEGDADCQLDDNNQDADDQNLINQKLRDVTIIVCSTCRKEDGSAERPTPGEQLFAATLAAKGRAVENLDNMTDGAGCPGEIKIISVECLGNCKRRLSAAVVTEQAWDYIFGDLSIENAGDLIEGARLMQETTNGLMPWRGRPQCMKSGMVARIPPLPLKSTTSP